MLKLILGSFAVVIAALMLTTEAGQVHAQSKTGGGGGGGTGGGGGGTGGGGGGTSGGTFGGSGATSSFGGAGGTSSSSGSGNSSNATYGSGSAVLGPYYDNPFSHGLSGNSSSTSSSAGNASSTSSSLASVANGTTSGGSGASSTTNAFQSSQAASSVKFGKALYNVSPVSTFTQPTTTGTASIRSPTNQQTNQNPVRVSYIARFSGPVQSIPVAVVNTDFQASLGQSPELSKPENRVQLVQDGDVVILRGVVQDARERALAEAVARMTPGVHSVRNELAVRDNSPDGTGSR